MIDMKPTLTENEIDEFVKKFFKHVTLSEQRPVRQVVIHIGGFPGSGKTTAAHKAVEKIKGAQHIQSNSVRWLLAQESQPYADNVPAIIVPVVERVLEMGLSLVLEGMFVDAEKRSLTEEIAKKYRLPMLPVFINGDVEVAKERDRKRSFDSTFDHWRPKPEKAELFRESMAVRKHKFEEQRDLIPGLVEIGNNADVQNLWQKIEIAVEDFVKEI